VFFIMGMLVGAEIEDWLLKRDARIRKAMEERDKERKKENER